MHIIKLLRLDKYQSVYIQRNGQHRTVLPICGVDGPVSKSIPRVVRGRIQDLSKTYDDQCDLFVLVAIKEDRLGCAAWPQNSGFDFKVISAEKANVG